jgi:hypothetical protein
LQRVLNPIVGLLPILRERFVMLIEHLMRFE